MFGWAYGRIILIKNASSVICILTSGFWVATYAAIFKNLYVQICLRTAAQVEYKWNYVSFPVHFNISETYFQLIICVAVQVHASGLEALILISIFSFIVDILLFSNCASVLAQFVGFFCPELCITKVLGMNNKCI